MTSVLIRFRRSAILAACALSCGAGCAPQVSLLPISRAGISPATAPPPAMICTASMLAEVPARPDPPADAGFPAPQTPKASGQVQAYLAWLHAWSVTTKILIARTTETRTFCLEHQQK